MPLSIITLVKKKAVAVGLLLPPSAQTLIELHQGQQLVLLCLDQVKFGRKIIRFIGEHLEIASDSTAVPHVGQPRRILRGVHEQLFLFTKLLCLAVGDQGVGNVAEGALNGLLIKEHCFLMLGFCEANVRPESTRCEYGLRER